MLESHKFIKLSEAKDDTQDGIKTKIWTNYAICRGLYLKEKFNLMKVMRCVDRNSWLCSRDGFEKKINGIFH